MSYFQDHWAVSRLKAALKHHHLPVPEEINSEEEFFRALDLVTDCEPNAYTTIQGSFAFTFVFKEKLYGVVNFDPYRQGKKIVLMSDNNNDPNAGIILALNRWKFITNVSSCVDLAVDDDPLEAKTAAYLVPKWHPSWREVSS
jgi:hypothetical protein